MKHVKLMAIAMIAIGMTVASCDKDDDKSEETCTTPPTGKEVMLVVKPMVGDQAIQLNTSYDINGQSVSFDELKFYISNLELMDDEGNVLVDNEGVPVLASTEQNAVMIGQTEASHLHMLRFDVGLDSITNHLSEDDWMNLPEDHPLYPSNMHWGWNATAGFKFFRMDYALDTPDIQSHAATDGLFQENVTLSAHHLSTAGDHIHIELSIDLAEMLDGLSLPAGSNHGPTQFNTAYMNKLGTGSPFTIE